MAGLKQKEGSPRSPGGKRQLQAERPRAIEPLGADLDALATFSARGNGVSRLAWTKEHADACNWLVSRMTDAGMVATIDPAGNVVGVLGPTSPPAKKAIVVGSHIDTVPEGGKFDGSLGVLAGLCVARSLSSRSPQRPYWLVAFMDEEGVRFGTPLFGARAFVGELPEVLDRTDEEGRTLQEVASASGLSDRDPRSAPRISDVAAYLELHIEQGPALEDGGYELGIVTAIMGRRVFEVRFSGEANHAGTTPRGRRRDALRGAAEFTSELHRVFDEDEQGTANVGDIDVSPGAVNVIPGEATCRAELRAATTTGLDRAEACLRTLAGQARDSNNLEGEVALVDSSQPVEFASELIELLEESALKRGARVKRLLSGAGHDAMIMASHVPAAMLMVPSRGGISHSPAEYTDLDLCELGTEVLTDAVMGLVGEPAVAQCA